MSQIDLFTYTEAQELTEPMYLALDVLHTRWASLDSQYWLDQAGYAKAVKLGMSEWYPLEKLPDAVNQRHVLEPLTERGWIEVTLEHEYWGRTCPCVRITLSGVNAWQRHQDACYRAWTDRDALDVKAKLMLSTVKKNSRRYKQS